MASRLLLIGCLLLLGTLSRAALAASPASSYTQEQRESLRGVRTLLVTSSVSTWLDLPTPPYNVPITVKTKLERAGFQVVFDSSLAHDAVVTIGYRETPGHQYQRLEQGTNISCRIALKHPGIGPVLSYDFDASTGPIPAGSLYWDAVQHLEENPYYYYLGELVKGWLSAQEEPGVVFSRALRQPAMTFSVDGGGTQPSDQVVANQEARLNAIMELGRLKERRALETLWELVRLPDERQRLAAVAAIGEIGDPASVEPLTRLISEADPDLRTAVESAIKHIQRNR
jgi:hypothetical protein